MVDFAPQLKKLLRRHGWELLHHGKGGHDIWWLRETGEKVTVDNKIKSRHTANGILKAARLPKTF